MEARTLPLDVWRMRTFTLIRWLDQKLTLSGCKKSTLGQFWSKVWLNSVKLHILL